MLKINEIKERVEKATEGPWKWEGDKFGDIVVYSLERRGFHNNGGEIAELAFGADADADFIANARTDIPELIAEIERLQKRISTVEDLLSEAHDLLDDVHCYDTDVYQAISDYFDGGDNE